MRLDFRIATLGFGESASIGETRPMTLIGRAEAPTLPPLPLGAPEVERKFHCFLEQSDIV